MTKRARFWQLMRRLLHLYAQPTPRKRTCDTCSRLEQQRLQTNRLRNTVRVLSGVVGVLLVMIIWLIVTH